MKILPFQQQHLSIKVCKFLYFCTPDLFYLWSTPPAYKVLSDKGKRRLYDNVGHAAFKQDKETSYNPEDGHESSFHFSFADFFHDFDESPFVEEQMFHWSFHQDVKDEGDLYEQYTFEEHGFSFYYDEG